MIKRIFPYILAIIVAIGVFIGGFEYGVHIFASMKSTTMLQDYFIQSTQSMSLLYDLENGKIDNARQALLLNIDSAVLTINGLAPYSDEQSYKTACNIMRGIAKHRRDNPSKYSSYSYPIEDKNSAAIRREISQILNKWESCDKEN